MILKEDTIREHKLLQIRMNLKFLKNIKMMKKRSSNSKKNNKRSKTDNLKITLLQTKVRFYKVKTLSLKTYQFYHQMEMFWLTK